jgi:hypothetical protein
MEVLESMNTESFVLAMIRFCNRYGIPKTVYSDNARTFVSGGNVLSDIFVSDLFKSKFSPYQIKFKRIPIYSPWYGATWERLIKTLKSCIYKTVGRSKLDYYSFITLISDVEAVMNSRPLTYRSSDNNLEVVTPNHFIRLHADTPSMVITSTDEFPDLEDVEDPNYDPYHKLIKSLDVREQLINKFTNVWLKDYLLSLKRGVATGTQNKTLPELQPGRVALMQSENKTRPFLKLVRIIEHMPSSDGNIRSVKVKQPDGTLTTIAVANLIPLELNASNICDSSLQESELSGDKVDPLCVRKAEISPPEPISNVVSPLNSPDKSYRHVPVRNAALKSRLATQNIFQEDY